MKLTNIEKEMILAGLKLYEEKNWEVKSQDWQQVINNLIDQNWLDDDVIINKKEN